MTRIPGQRGQLKTRLLVSMTLATLATLAGAALFGSGGGDDSHITWYVVDTLCRTGHIVNLNGVALEQSSSVGLVIIAAALRCILPISTPALGVALSLVATIAVAVTSGRVAARLDDRLELPAVVLVATSGSLAYWGTSGMETALAALATAWILSTVPVYVELSPSAPRSDRRRAFAACVGAFLLYATVRPENPLILMLTLGGSVCLHAMSRRAVRLTGEGGSQIRSGLVMLGAGATIAGSLFGIRRLVFGEWFPHPVAAKMGGEARWSGGAQYLWTQAGELQPALLPLLGVALLLLLWHLVRRRDARFLLSLLVVQSFAGLLFVCGSGGDWMGYGRFLVPQLPAWWIALLAALVVNGSLLTKLVVPATSLLAIGNVICLIRMGTGANANGYPITAAVKVVREARARYGLERYSFIELSNKSHLRDAMLAEALAGVLDEVVKLGEEPIWIASGQAGAVPFDVFPRYPGRLRFMDLWALTTTEAVRCMPQNQMRPSPLGTSISLQLLYANRATLQSKCGIPMPQVIFNTGLRPATLAFLKRMGYRVVYSQRGAMPSFTGPSQFKGGTRMDAYVAVREDLAARLKLEPRQIDWDIGG